MAGRGLKSRRLAQTGRCQDLSIAAFSGGGAARTARMKINVTFKKSSRVTACAHASSIYAVYLEFQPIREKLVRRLFFVTNFIASLENWNS